MSQYDDIVEKQRILLAAEEWASGIKGIHVHSLSSMAYDDRPDDTKDGSVTDTEYNNGLIERSKNGKVIHYFGNKLEGDALIDSFTRRNS
tara:strand:- start:14858 stop:15127 length:270 start_codon:yes stop_codon:yes gene_type:complete